MAVQVEAAGQPTAADRPWYARSPDEVTAALHVDPAVGLTAARAGELLSANGPNALPEEKPKPGWRRFAEEYRAYMQIILVAAAVVSLLVKEWSTAVLLLLLTVLNAVVGLRQEGPPYVTRHNNNGFVDYNEQLFSWQGQIKLAGLAAEAVERDASVLVANASHRDVLDLYPGFHRAVMNRYSTLAGNSASRGPVEEELLWRHSSLAEPRN